MGKPIRWIIAVLILLNLVVVFFPDKEDRTYVAIQDAYRDGNGEALLRYMLNQSLSFRDRRLEAANNLGRLIKNEEKHRPKYEILLANLRDNAANENEALIFLVALNSANSDQDRKKLKPLWNTIRPLVDAHRGSRIKIAQENGTIPALTPGTEVDLIMYASWGRKKNSNTFRSTFGSSSIGYKGLTSGSIGHKGLTSEEIESRIRGARTAGIVVRSKFVVGEYVGDYAGIDAFRHAAELYLVDLEEKKILKAERVLGSMPPESTVVPVYQPGVKPKWKPKPKTSGDLPDVKGYFIDRHAGAANPSP